MFPYSMILVPQVMKLPTYAKVGFNIRKSLSAEFKITASNLARWLHLRIAPALGAELEQGRPRLDRDLQYVARAFKFSGKIRMVGKVPALDHCALPHISRCTLTPLL